MIPSKPDAGDPERSNAGQNLADGSSHLPQKRPGARATLREHVAATLKVIALSGGLLGGLWLLQMVAQK